MERERELAMLWRRALPILLLLSSGALFGCGNLSAAANPTPTHKAPADTRVARHTIWVQPKNERYTPKKAWLRMSDAQIARLGAEKGWEGLPLFAGVQVRRMVPRYAESVLTRTQKVPMWTDSKRITYNPRDFRMVDA